MKNSINNLPRISGKNFIYCFTSVYMFLENIEITGEAQERCQNGAICCGCGGCGNPRAKYIQMFDTMCGHSATRCRYDGELSEMQKLIGGYEIKKNVYSDYSMDFTVDFLFGFVGYEYRNCVNKATFKNEITASINKDIPIIAKVSSNGSASYHVITGHDGDMITDSDSETVFRYDDFEMLFVFGDKITPRYTVKDGLERVKQVMESNVNEGIWDGYAKKFENYINFNAVDLDERNFRMQRLVDAMGYACNIYPFNAAFYTNSSDVAQWQNNFGEMRDPALNDIWIHLSSCCDTIMWIVHTICFYLNHTIDWSIGNGNVLNGLYEMIWLTIGRVKELEAKILNYIKQAIEVLDKK